MLPRVKLYFENGTLGSTSPSDDGVTGLVASAVAVAGKFALGTAYLITKLDGLATYGITSDETDVNANIYKVVKEFYDEAIEGTKLWFLGALNTVPVADLVDKTKPYAKTLIESAKGAINVLMVSKTDPAGYVPVILDALDSDIYTGMINAQALGEWVTESKFAPLFTLLEGRHYTGISASLRNLFEGGQNRVGIFIGDTISGSTGASIGLLAGRIATIPVQRSIARVKSGAISATTLYIGDKAPENGDPDIINDAGFITFRSFVGKAGYYFTDDKLATAVTDDYALIPRRRVIDKAYRIAYQTIVNELGDEIPLEDDGTMPAPIITSIQNTVETAIENNMTAYGNLGVVPGSTDTGVSCYIDKTQNIRSTSSWIAKLRVKPYGYSKYIDVYLGFKVAS
jgi:hypothetical protein